MTYKKKILYLTSIHSHQLPIFFDMHFEDTCIFIQGVTISIVQSYSSNYTVKKMLKICQKRICIKCSRKECNSRSEILYSVTQKSYYFLFVVRVEYILA
jgi:hypothetical protein